MSERCQGRRMPFYRYLETIYCAKKNYQRIFNLKHVFNEVIERALREKSVPLLWNNIPEIGYNKIKEIKD